MSSGCFCDTVVREVCLQTLEKTRSNDDAAAKAQTGS